MNGLVSFLVLLFMHGSITVVLANDDDITEQACDPSTNPVLVEDPTTILQPPLTENGTYQHDQDCQWLVQAPQGSIVAIDFAFVDLDPVHPCADASITLYDSNTSTNALTELCGSVQPPTVRTSYRHLLVTFQSSSSGTGTGFQASFVFVNVEEVACQTGDFKADGWLNGGFTSPNWGVGSYPGHSSCQWTIASTNEIRLEFTDFDVQPDGDPTQCPHHNVKVYDVGNSSERLLLGEYCGDTSDKTASTMTLPPILGSMGHSLEVNLQTNSKAGGSGFRAKFFTQNTTEVGCGLSKPAEIDWAPGIITGPKSNEASCSWRLNTTVNRLITLWTAYFDLPEDCSLASLQVFDGQTHNAPLLGEYCGTGWSGQLTVGSSISLIRYSTSQLLPHSGFQLKYVFYDVAEHACGSDKPVELTHSSGLVTSPKYRQGHYPNSANCQWLLTATFGWVIRLEMRDFEVEYCETCRCDYLDVTNGNQPTDSSTLIGRYCGTKSSVQAVTTAVSSAYLTFVSDSRQNGDGFSIAFSHVYLPEVACGINRPAAMSHEPGDIISHGFEAGEDYQADSKCEWLISAGDMETVQLTVLDLMLESTEQCYKDYLEIYDGLDEHRTLLDRLCGSVRDKSYKSSGSYMYVKFISDDSVQAPGFHLHYTYIKTSSVNHLGFLPGLLIAMLLLVACCMVVAYCHVNDKLKRFKMWVCRRLGRTSNNANEQEMTSSTTRTSTGQHADNTDVLRAPAIRSVVTPPSDVDNMHYFAIADYAPPTYEEATSSSRQTPHNPLQSTNQNPLQSTNQNPQNTDNQTAENGENINQSTNNSDSLASTNQTASDIRLNHSTFGNADMGTSILRQAGVLNTADTLTRRDTRINTLPHTSTSNRDRSSPSETRPPDLTFNSSISNSGFNMSGASAALGSTASTFTDVTQDSNLYNPVYSALHNTCISAHQHNASVSAPQNRPSDSQHVLDSEEDSTYDTPKEYKSQENLIIPTDGSRDKVSRSNAAFVKGAGSVSLLPAGSSEAGERDGTLPGKSKDQQYVNMAFQRTNSRSSDTEI